eukprot:GGOE01058374.1.p1 GENE.GGOE01058374.1~~GGOE01058374.1.p1  ORF type:complete len:520 (-),score=124.11 GGOE01058374.1:313-1848(-)
MGAGCSCGLLGRSCFRPAADAHHFLAVHLNLPLPCMKCGGLIQGEGKQALRCWHCRYTIHRGCKGLLASHCSHVEHPPASPSAAIRAHKPYGKAGGADRCGSCWTRHPAGGQAFCSWCTHEIRSTRLCGSLPGLHALLSFETLVLSIVAKEDRPEPGEGVADAGGHSPQTERRLKQRRKSSLTWLETQADVPVGWGCPCCTFRNVGHATNCSFCGEPRLSPGGKRRNSSQSALEMVALHARLDGMHLQQMAWEDDGNCQFRALSYQLFRDPRYYPNLRRIAVEEITNFQFRYMHFFQGAADFKNYVSRMAQDGTWGDDVTLRAICDRFGVVAHVITAAEMDWHVCFTPTRQCHPVRRHIFLSLVYPVHYNSVTHLLEDAEYLLNQSPDRYGNILRNAKECSPTFSLDFSAVSEVLPRESELAGDTCSSAAPVRDCSGSSTGADFTAASERSGDCRARVPLPSISASCLLDLASHTSKDSTTALFCRRQSRAPPPLSPRALQSRPFKAAFWN